MTSIYISHARTQPKIDTEILRIVGICWGLYVHNKWRNNGGGDWMSYDIARSISNILYAEREEKGFVCVLVFLEDKRQSYLVGERFTWDVWMSMMTEDSDVLLFVHSSLSHHSPREDNNSQNIDLSFTY